MTGSYIVAAILLVPAMAWAVLVHVPGFSRRDRAGAVLGFVAMFVGTLSVWALGASQAYWSFSAGAGAFYGVPMDFAIGVSILIGALPSFVLRTSGVAVRIAAGVIGAFALSWLPVLDFADPGARMMFALMTAMLGAASLTLAVLTTQDRHVYVRSVLQLACWLTFLLWFVPSLIIQNFGYNWQPVVTRGIGENVLWLLLSAPPFALICAALWQFAYEGDGTGFPYDPPKQLVTGGVYSYISNPMQLGIVGLLLTWPGFTGVLWVGLTAPVSLLLFVVFKNVCNGSFSLSKTDPFWMDYQSNVPRWRPRLTGWSTHGKALHAEHT